MSADRRLGSRETARLYFAVQAFAGVAWWVAVAVSDDVRRWTLGGWDPRVLIGPDLVLFAGASALAAVTGRRSPGVVAAIWTTTVAAALGVYGLVDRVAGWGVVLMAVAAIGSVAAAGTIWAGHLPTRWFFIGPFSFNVADEASSRRHLGRSLTQLVIFWTSFFVLVPIALAAVESRLRLRWDALDRASLDALAVVTFSVASVLGLWSCVAMALQGNGTPLPAATARDLVVAGPYRWVRNPMAVAGAIQTASVGLWIGSWMVIAIAVAGAVAWDIVIRPVEEADLAARFGASFDEYAQRVRCWVPTRPG